MDDKLLTSVIGSFYKGCTVTSIGYVTKYFLFIVRVLGPCPQFFLFYVVIGDILVN